MASPAQVAKLMQKITELQNKVRQLEVPVTEIFCDDIFEFLIVARPDAMAEKLKDVVNCKPDFYRLLSEKDLVMKQILMFFEGKTIKDKKDALRNYLRENPIFRTQKPELLLQRLRLTRRYATDFRRKDIPEQPIQETLDELNSQEAPKAPKDEDFLE